MGKPILILWHIGRLKEYQVIGRHLPTEMNPTPKLYRMRIFAPNVVVAKSRFWYFLMKLKKVKKSNGEIVTINQVQASPRLATRNIWGSEKQKLTSMSLRYMRSAPPPSRTLVFGFGTIRDQGPTTCTRSTEKCQGQRPLTRCTRTWQRGIERDLGPFTYGLSHQHCVSFSNFADRSSELL